MLSVYVGGLIGYVFGDIDVFGCNEISWGVPQFNGSLIFMVLRGLIYSLCEVHILLFRLSMRVAIVVHEHSAYLPYTKYMNVYCILSIVYNVISKFIQLHVCSRGCIALSICNDTNTTPCMWKCVQQENPWGG